MAGSVVECVGAVYYRRRDAMEGEQMALLGSCSAVIRRSSANTAANIYRTKNGADGGKTAAGDLPFRRPPLSNYDEYMEIKGLALGENSTAFREILEYS